MTNINQGVDNWIHVQNTDPLNTRGRNNCHIIIYNKNSRHK